MYEVIDILSDEEGECKVIDIDTDESDDNERVEILQEAVPDKDKIVKINSKAEDENCKEDIIQPEGSSLILTETNFLELQNGAEADQLTNSIKCLKNLRKCYINVHNILDGSDTLNCQMCLKSGDVKVNKDKIKSQLLTSKCEKNLFKLQCNQCLNFYSSKVYLKFHACAADKDEDEDTSIKENRSDASEEFEKVVESKPAVDEHETVESSLEQNVNLTKKNCIEESLNLEKSINLNEIEKFFACKSELEMPVPAHDKESYSCNVCGKVFKWEMDLKNHLLFHVNGGYDCSKCGKSYELKLHFTRHMKTHSDKKLFPGKKFKQSVQLKTDHEIHPKAYICQVCGENFSKRYVLNLHQQTHFEVWPYNCVACGKGFTRLSGFKYHQLSKPACSIGIKSHSFGVINLKKDKLRPFSCNQCGKTFKKKCHVEDHLTSHSNKRPHVCNKCDKAFKLNRELKKHQRFRHAGETV